MASSQTPLGPVEGPASESPLILGNSESVLLPQRRKAVGVPADPRAMTVSTEDICIGSGPSNDARSNSPHDVNSRSSFRSRRITKTPNYFYSTDRSLIHTAQASNFASDVSADVDVQMSVEDGSNLDAEPNLLLSPMTPATAQEIADPGPKCSYAENCTTGSPLRKVVSHIFGRNKLCTRQIPQGVWVHYCRKHYQRSRYRNPRGFALLQCDLVRKQIDRLDSWGGVASWIVKVRKREEIRLSLEDVEIAASSLSQQNPEVSGSAESAPEGMNAGSTDNIESSRWMKEFTGNGKSTREVLDVLDRIELQIAEFGGNFPDVEILPNVCLEVPSIAREGATPRGRPAERRTIVSSRARRERDHGPQAECSLSRVSRGKRKEQNDGIRQGGSSSREDSHRSSSNIPHGFQTTLDLSAKRRRTGAGSQ
ncbi:MAG: hypothetical protein M1819_003573 [Sarea resinae]|nr:MAG: hypothetical protein M1819_003573 [Sarea resinae]